MKMLIVQQSHGEKSTKWFGGMKHGHKKDDGILYAVCSVNRVYE